jgi:hypothetical protein
MLVFSVDVPLVSNQTDQIALTTAAEALLQCAERYAIGISWFVEDLARACITDRLCHSRVAHEIGLLAHNGWFASRNQMARLLAQQMDLAATRGLNVASVALADAYVVSELDLLVRHHIRVVRGPMARMTLRRSTTYELPRALSARFGVWYTPVHYVVGHALPWWCGGQRSAIRALRERVERSADLLTIGIDLQAAIRDAVNVASLANQLFAWADHARRSGKTDVALVSPAILQFAHAASQRPALASALRRSA